ncbi:MAG: hypothetical protein L6R40_003486 [Gallowayella cf. fulva]|nr:MAG: hypothetical protein L6R40_003486 [Xanthomendoza cf. fulva]
MNLLECDQSRIHGSLGGYDQEVIKVAAVPDTGAEGNIMDGAHRNLLQFADGTYQETVGQVQTNWTFASSECIPLIFEVLENCCSDVVLGDTILYDYNVFEDHAASILSYESLDSMLQLAPFDFVKNWQRNPSSLLPGHKNRKLRSASHLRQHKPNRQR